MSQAELFYVADPLCSWCYGFAPQMEKIRAAFDRVLAVRLVMGGLRAGAAKPMDAQLRGYVLDHWRHVHQATGRPFRFDFVMPEGWIYDTEPACRAVRAAEAVAAGSGLGVMATIQEAFYQKNLDVTRAAILADAAQQAGLDRAAFERALEDENIHQATRTDFALAAHLQVQGFPTLLGVRQGRATPLARGAQPAEALIPRIRSWASEAP